MNTKICNYSLWWSYRDRFCHEKFIKNSSWISSSLRFIVVFLWERNKNWILWFCDKQEREEKGWKGEVNRLFERNYYATPLSLFFSLTSSYLHFLQSFFFLMNYRWLLLSVNGTYIATNNHQFQNSLRETEESGKLGK